MHSEGLAGFLKAVPGVLVWVAKFLKNNNNVGVANFDGYSLSSRKGLLFQWVALDFGGFSSAKLLIRWS